MLLDKDWYEELLNKVDLVGLVSKYVRLTKKGNKYWGCCPFHHEKDPSFTVNGDGKFYYCFGCKESGNAITFLSKIESIEKFEAIKMLCESVGMKIPDNDNRKNVQSAQIAKKKERLFEMMREAAIHYNENLKTSAAKTANEYLANRGIDKRLVTKFGMGLSINGSELLEYLKKKGYSYKEMKEAGLAEQKADSYYDVFYGRLIIPIINNRGQVVGFGGRTLEKDAKFAKYRNSAQTILFDKSKTIFGINLLKKKKQTSPINYCIMTEGYMDTISLHKAGFDTAVASMGTSLTNEQARQLKNYSSNVYISYDGDGAGQKATLRGLDILESVGLNVKVVCLPDGLDPDDVIRQKGAEFYRKLLDEAISLTSFKLKTLLKNYDLTQPQGKSKYAYEAIKIIKKLPTLIEQEEYLKVVNKYTGYSMDILRKQAEILVDEQSESKLTTQVQENTNFDAETFFILVSMLHRRQYVDYEEDIYELLSDDFFREIYSLIIDSYKNDDINIGAIFEATSKENHDKLSKMVGYEFIEGDDALKYERCLNSLKNKKLKEEIDELNLQYNSATDEQTKNKIREKILKLVKKMQLMKKIGG